MPVNKGKVIAITSVKGGTGKSIFTLNMAGLLARKNLKTIIIDLDLNSGIIAPVLNLNSNKDIFNLADDMMNNRMEDIEKYIRKYNENISVLAAPKDPRLSGKIHHQYIENIIKQLTFRYDVILIDTSHIINSYDTIAFDISDEILYLITDDIMDLKNMKNMISIYEDMNIDKYKIIINGMLYRYYTNYEIKNILGKDIDYTIASNYYNHKIQKYIIDGKIPSFEKPSDKSLDTVKLIIRDILK